jgi:hypothetical protein
MAAQFLWQRLYVSLSLSLPFPTSLQRASSCLIGQERIQLPGGGIGYRAIALLFKNWTGRPLNMTETFYYFGKMGFPCRGSTTIPVSSSYRPCLSKCNNSCITERIVIKFGIKKCYEIFRAIWNIIHDRAILMVTFHEYQLLFSRRTC